MPYFDRFDICEAYWCYASDYNLGGYATGRPWRPVRLDNGRTNGDIFTRLSYMRFRPHPHLSTDTLTENGRAIYDALVARKEHS